MLETSLKQLTLRQVNQASYFAVRRWRQSLKRHQISALVAAKEDPSPSFVEALGSEMAEAVRVLYGATGIENVVPMPPGNSGREECLSVRLGAVIATKLAANFRNVLVSQGGSGGSHPRKSAQLQPFKISRKVTGPILLVDDVASSGRHMELAQLALREMGGPTIAIAWICN